ncbi:hypothetical protein BC830DRAFT_907080 [Chytriomyces sp. MP71]|nr:hypothetical protein BC830DRAFT_907080 [Chytriomyces sp. MP71]
MLRLLRGELLVTGVKAGPNSTTVPYISSPVRMQVNDVMYENFGEHLVTFGEMGITNEENGNADPVSPTCVDYIMLINAKEPKRAIGRDDDAYNDTMDDADEDARYSKAYKSSHKKLVTKGGIVVDSGSTKVEKLVVEGEDFVQLSDHYGLATSVFVPAT